jgi:uncharacterized FlaG/YvyC family protein
MKISPGQTQSTPVESASTSAKQVRTERVSTPEPSATTAEIAARAAATQAAKPIEDPTNVTLRRDTNGRVYYVVSDANSGEEILEVPPKALRDVGQGIEDYLKEEQSKAGAHVKVKA